MCGSALITVGKTDLAFVVAFEARDYVQQSRLAAARRSKHTHEFSSPTGRWRSFQRSHLRRLADRAKALHPDFRFQLLTAAIDLARCSIGRMIANSIT